jgi:hypothetical protein
MNRSQRAMWASRAAIAIAATTAGPAHAADAPAMPSTSAMDQHRKYDFGLQQPRRYQCRGLHVVIASRRVPLLRRPRRREFLTRT